jgi:hypothetical protein
MKELVEAIAKALVDNPDKVHVRAIEGEQVTVFELRVHKSDLGKVIGPPRTHGPSHPHDPECGGHEVAEALHTRNP